MTQTLIGSISPARALVLGMLSRQQMYGHQVLREPDLERGPGKQGSRRALRTGCSAASATWGSSGDLHRAGGAAARPLAHRARRTAATWAGRSTGRGWPPARWTSAFLPATR